ncbi:hypothetical protein ACET3Z_030232 [Daucus carota]
MDIMFKSSNSRGTHLGKRPASTAQENRGKKRATEQMEEPREITVKVKSQVKEVSFKVKHNTKMQKIFKKFCDKSQVEYRTMQFFFDGSRVPPTATPHELNMSDGDEIEAMIHAGGGGNPPIV